MLSPPVLAAEQLPCGPLRREGARGAQREARGPDPLAAARRARRLGRRPRLPRLARRVHARLAGAAAPAHRPRPHRRRHAPHRHPRQGLLRLQVEPRAQGQPSVTHVSIQIAIVFDLCFP